MTDQPPSKPKAQSSILAENGTARLTKLMTAYAGADAMKRLTVDPLGGEFARMQRVIAAGQQNSAVAVFMEKNSDMFRGLERAAAFNIPSLKFPLAIAAQTIFGLPQSTMKALVGDLARTIMPFESIASVVARQTTESPFSRFTLKMEADIARLTKPIIEQSAFAAWETTLTTRLASIQKAWTLPDHLGDSMLGFARLTRLSEAVHTPTPYAEPVVELVAEELGAGVIPTDLDDASPVERDVAAVDAGLNPQLIAFSPSTYSQVIVAAGFNFQVKFPIPPAPQPIEGANGDAAFDPMHHAAITAAEQHLRQFITVQLQALVGRSWIKQRVPESVRNAWQQRQQVDRDHGRPVFAPIQYANFMDMATIIDRKDNWSEAFGHILRNREAFIQSLHRLHPVRLATAHSRPLSRFDVLTLVSETTRVFLALGIDVFS